QLRSSRRHQARHGTSACAPVDSHHAGMGSGYCARVSRRGGRRSGRGSAHCTDGILMQEPIVATQSSSLRWRGTAARSVGALGAVTFAAAGLLFSRADVVALALPLAIWTVLAARPPAATAKLRVHLTAEAPESS